VPWRNATAIDLAAGLYPVTQNQASAVAAGGREGLDRAFETVEACLSGQASRPGTPCHNRLRISEVARQGRKKDEAALRSGFV
jgi:hypothetical protein